MFWQDDSFWSYNSKDGVKVPIGWDINEDVINFEFGFDYSEHHTLIGGRSGSGKSNLVNIIIQNLAYLYSPKEIEMFLLDYKEGVEFQVFKNHPNCKKIFLDNEDKTRVLYKRNDGRFGLY